MLSITSSATMSSAAMCSFQNTQGWGCRLYPSDLDVATRAHALQRLHLAVLIGRWNLHHHAGSLSRRGNDKTSRERVAKHKMERRPKTCEFEVVFIKRFGGVSQRGCSHIHQHQQSSATIQLAPNAGLRAKTYPNCSARLDHSASCVQRFLVRATATAKLTCDVQQQSCSNALFETC